MSKIEPIKITLERAEGMCEECVKVEITHGHGAGGDLFLAADRILSEWARTAPSCGAYNKIDFEIAYQDGNTYDGRFDLQRQHVGERDLLGGHVESFLRHMVTREGAPHSEAWLFLESYLVGRLPEPVEV